MNLISFMYITNRPKVAKICENAGVERIFVDMEWKGKAIRQGHLDSVKSFHTLDDVAKIRKVLKRSKLLVRVNPVDDNTPTEVSGAIEAGADILMLPMARTCDDVQQFLDAVGGRVKTVLLLETRWAKENIDSILGAGGIDEVHIGLNDLSLDYGYPFMFTPLANGIVENLCSRISKFSIPYGFGGIGRLGEGRMPAERILMEHVRLGSTRVILSRSFYNSTKVQDLTEAKDTFDIELGRIRDAETVYRKKTREDLLTNLSYIKRLCS